MTRHLAIAALGSSVAGAAIVGIGQALVAPPASNGPPSAAAAMPDSPVSIGRARSEPSPREIDAAEALSAAVERELARSPTVDAVARMAEAIARSDPAAGLALAEAIEDDGHRSVFLSFLFRQWARIDPSGFLDALPHLAKAGGPLSAAADRRSRVDAVKLAGEAIPERALEIGEKHGGAVDIEIRLAAIEALAARAPMTAIDYVNGSAPGGQRDRMLAAAATGYARGDLEAAVAWLATLGDSDGAAFYPIIRELAKVDLPRAIALDAWAFELDYGGRDCGHQPA